MVTPIYQHVNEIRWRFFYYIVSFLFSVPLIWNFLPYYFTLYGDSLINRELGLYSLDISETIYTSVWFTVYLSILISLPLLLYHIWCFLLPGLYKYESYSYNTFFTLVIFLTLFCYFYGLVKIWPLISTYLLDFNKSNLSWGLEVSTQPRLESYLYWAALIPLICVIFVLLPIFLVISQFFKFDLLAKRRRLIYLVSLLLSAFCAPPIPLLQLNITIILVFLYEICLLILTILSLVKERNDIVQNQA